MAAPAMLVGLLSLFMFAPGAMDPRLRNYPAAESSAIESVALSITPIVIGGLSVLLWFIRRGSRDD